MMISVLRAGLGLLGVSLVVGIRDTIGGGCTTKNKTKTINGGGISMASGAVVMVSVLTAGLDLLGGLLAVDIDISTGGRGTAVTTSHRDWPWT